MNEPSPIKLDDHYPEIDNKQKDFIPVSSVSQILKESDFQDFVEHSNLAISNAQ